MSGAKHDTGKLRLSLVPASLDYAVAAVREYGVAKYGARENWRTIEQDRYFDALLRHVQAMRENGVKARDEESGFNELAGPIPLLSQIAGAFQYNKPLTQSTVFTGVESAMKLGKNAYSVFDNPNDPQTWSRMYKSGIDLAAYRLGVGNVRRLYETGAEGWEDLQLGRTHNPFRLFFRKPRE